MKKRKTLILLVSLLVVSIVVGIGGMYSKYIETEELISGNVSVTSASLAKTFTLKEHKANRQSNGEYKLDTTSEVFSNSYTVIPGITLPKDPFITIEKETSVSAYMYVEIVNKLGTSGVSYSVAGNWKPLNVTGENGGDLYVYTEGGTTEKVISGNYSQDKIYILNDNEVSVENDSSISGSVTLELYGYLLQTTGNENATACYQSFYGGGN